MKCPVGWLALILLGIAAVSAFSPARATRRQDFALFSSVPSDVAIFDLSLDDLKADLVSTITRSSSKPLVDEVRSLVRQLEEKAEQVRADKNY
jgi:hypothetical protein